MGTRALADFPTLLQASISEGMRQVLGNGGAQAILYHLALPSFDDPKRFHEKLSAIFGVGTGSLERVILQHLHRAVGRQPSSSDGDFVAQVEVARKSFDASMRGRRRRSERA